MSIILLYKDGTAVTCPACGSDNVSPLWAGASEEPTDAVCEDCEELI